MTAIYAVTFVMSAVLICKWTLSHYDDDDDDDDELLFDWDVKIMRVTFRGGPLKSSLPNDKTSSQIRAVSRRGTCPPAPPGGCAHAGRR